MNTKTAAPAEMTNERAERIGKKLAEVLNLHPVKGYIPTRYATAWGTKTAQGVARTVARILSEEAES